MEKFDANNLYFNISPEILRKKSIKGNIGAAQFKVYENGTDFIEAGRREEARSISVATVMEILTYPSECLLISSNLHKTSPLISFYFMALMIAFKMNRGEDAAMDFKLLKLAALHSKDKEVCAAIRDSENGMAE